MKNKRHSFKKIEFKKREKEPLKPLFKKQKLVIAMSVLLVVLITMAGSFAVFTKTGEGNEYNVVQVGDLELSYVDLSNEGNVLQLADSYPTSDINGEASTPYRFSVENTGTIIADYTVKIIKDIDTINADGCGNNLIDDSYLRFKFDNGTSQNLKDKLDAVTNEYVIYSGTLAPFESNIHEIRLWINENSPNSILGTHYHGKVVIEVTQNNTTNPYERPYRLADQFAEKADKNKVIDFSQISNETNGRGIYKYQEDGEDIYYWRGKVTDNHIIFAGYCWEMVRTTKTGGVKMIYDGTPVGGKCTNTGMNSQLPETKGFSPNDSSPAYVGYMYGNKVYESKYKSSTDAPLSTPGILYGNDVVWDGTSYKLVPKAGNSLFSSTGKYISDREIGNGNHYTCFSNVDTCQTVYYTYYIGDSSDVYDVYYIELTNGITIEKALEQMYSNEQPSIMKTTLENWFESTELVRPENLQKLEDTVFCNDRSVEDKNYCGWLKDGNASSYMYYASYTRVNQGTPDLSCRQTSGNRDRFTYKDTVDGNGLLKYPVGLLTADEVMLAGGVYSNANEDYYLTTGNIFWTFSPGWYMNNAQGLNLEGSGMLYYYNVYRSGAATRPVISLSSSTKFSKGTGTEIDPYTVLIN